MKQGRSMWDCKASACRTWCSGERSPCSPQALGWHRWDCAPSTACGSVLECLWGLRCDPSSPWIPWMRWRMHPGSPRIEWLAAWCEGQRTECCPMSRCRDLRLSSENSHCRRLWCCWCRATFCGRGLLYCLRRSKCTGSLRMRRRGKGFSLLVWTDRQMRSTVLDRLCDRQRAPPHRWDSVLRSGNSLAALRLEACRLANSSLRPVRKIRVHPVGHMLGRRVVLPPSNRAEHRELSHNRSRPNPAWI